MNKIWIGLGILLTMLGLILFGMYWYHLPVISSDHAAWSSFGSLLSGFFTLGGVLATIATLLFLNSQNQNQQRFIDWQIKTQTFEQYINHRKLFIERLGELQTVCENKIRFHNPERTYNKIFPNNNPTQLEFEVKPNRSTDNENLLGRLGSRLERLDEMLDKSQWNGEETKELVDLLFFTSSDLQIEWIGDASDGDLLFDRKNIGINIYSLDEFAGRAKTIYNSFLFYTGNPPFKGFGKGSSRYVREALMKYFNSLHHPKHTLIALKATPGLAVMERMLFVTDSLRGPDLNWIMQNTFRTLESIFNSREDVIKLRDDIFVHELLSIGCQESSLGMIQFGEDDKRFPMLKHCWEEMNTLLARYR